jgi:methyl-accepting chemotaxis protein
MVDLNSAIDQVSSVISDNIERSQLATASVGEVLETIKSVAAISQENAASAETMTARTGLVSQHAQEVNDAAAALTGIARELQGSVARFKLDGSADEVAAPADATRTGPAALQTDRHDRKAA